MARTVALIPYTPKTWTPEQAQCHLANDLEGAFSAASSLSGGWYRRAVTIDCQVTDDLDERYMVRPSEVPALDGWTPCYKVEAIR